MAPMSGSRAPEASEERISKLPESARRQLEAAAAEVETAARAAGPERELDGSPADLEAVQALIDSRTLDPADEADRERLAAYLGAMLERHLDLYWVEVEDELGGEPALRHGETSILFYPRRIVATQVRAAPRLDLPWLFKSTREYLRNLIRFYPSQL